MNLPPPPPTCDWPTRIQTSYFTGPYNLHYQLFSVIGALLSHHPYCFPSQSQTLFGIGAGRPLGWTFPFQHQLPSPTGTSPLQHKPSPDQKPNSTQSPNCNMGVAQDTVQSLAWRTRNDRLSDKILTKMSRQYFFNVFWPGNTKTSLVN